MNECYGSNTRRKICNRSLLKTVFALTVPVVLCSALGCEEFHKPLYDVGNRLLVVVPFREPDKKLWYGWSHRGEVVVDAFRRWAGENGTGYFVEGSEAREFADKVARWNDKRIDREDWRQLALGVEADLILVGDILEVRHKQPEDVNIYRGSAKMRYQLLNTRSGKISYSSPTREVTFPRRGETNIPYSVLDYHNRPEAIERGLLNALGERLGKDLYGYYTP